MNLQELDLLCHQKMLSNTERLCVFTVCGIQCYECVHNNQRVKRHDRYIYPCAEFDGSSRYVMDCPDSPYCVYQRITLTLATGNMRPH